MPGWLVGGWWCCCPGCVIFLDEFNNADISSWWTQKYGVWTVDTVNEKAVAPSGGIMICDIALPEPYFYVTVDTYTEPVGGVWKIVLLWQEGPSTYEYYYAKWERLTSTKGRLSVGYCDNGSDSDYASFETPAGYSDSTTARKIVVCLSKGGIRAETTGAVSYRTMWPIVPVQNVLPRAGLAAGTTSVKFDNFQLERHRDGKPECDWCQCLCDGKHPKQTAKIATVTNAWGKCASLEGLTSDPLVFEPSGSVYGCQWIGDIPLPEFGVMLTLRGPGDGGPTDWVLTTDHHECIRNGIYPTLGSDCDPFNLVFEDIGHYYPVGPEYCSCKDHGSDGGYDLVITDAP